jgi:hypothetical protein
MVTEPGRIEEGIYSVEIMLMLPLDIKCSILANTWVASQSRTSHKTPPTVRRSANELQCLVVKFARGVPDRPLACETSRCPKG